MERTKLESAAAENSHLRGLFAIPMGGLMMLAALGNWEVGPLRHGWVFVACGLLIALTCLPLARYYNERFGRVTPSKRQQMRAGLAVVICVPIMIGGSLLLSSRASWSLDLPVNPTAISFALVMLVTYAMSVGLKAHHKVVFGVLLVAGLIPAWAHEGMSGNAGLALAAVAVAIAGILDHRLLVQTFGPSHGLDAEHNDVRA
ncbi:MAG: hypothetical protein QOG42_464 [Solirubrobacteraceae bacterium]|jgi:MFS family permease|nr:hypothetical protein [Solirubrobacteraceae bacterium]